MTIYYVSAANSASNTLLLSGQIWFVFFTSHKAASRTITYKTAESASQKEFEVLCNAILYFHVDG